MTGVGKHLEYRVRYQFDEPPGDRFSPERIVLSPEKQRRRDVREPAARSTSLCMSANASACRSPARYSLTMRTGCGPPPKMIRRLRPEAAHFFEYLGRKRLALVD